MAQRGLCSLCSQILEICVGIKKQNIGASNENNLKADVYIIYNYDSATFAGMIVMALCRLIKFPEGPVYVASSNIYSVLWLALYGGSTKRCRKKKLNGLVKVR